MRKGGNPYYSGPVSDHFDGVRFFNPGGAAPRGFVDLLRWRSAAARRDGRAVTTAHSRRRDPI